MPRTRKRSLQDFDSPGIVRDTLPLDSIAPPLYNPRTYFDPEKLQQLADSFKDHGMIGRLTVRPVEGKERPYELVAGERRFRAARLANLTEVPVEIKELTDQQAIALALEENLNREDLNPIEETEGILQLLSLESGLEKSEITSLLYKMVKGRDVPTTFKEVVDKVFESIKNLTWQTFARDRLRLLNLPEPILEAIRQGNIEYTKGIEIAKVQNPSLRDELLKEAITNNLSLKDIKDKIAQHKGKTSTDYSDLSTEELIEDVRQTYQRFSRSKKVWSDQKNRKKIETLLKQLKSLIEEYD
jgi:ParB family chromosome partitioning protein